MFKIVIKERERAARAIMWCMNNLDKNNWTVHTTWPAEGFIFAFNRDCDTSWFGLHWAK